MPEGPELHLASRFVNNCCQGITFSGRIVKSDVHKSDIQFRSDAYTISAKSRGKEVQLYLCSDRNLKKKDQNFTKTDPSSHTTILFRFGMSGKFEFTSENNIHRHAHLKFFTRQKPKMVLSYVDVRRFGRWEETAKWGTERGQDPIFEYQCFRSSVINNLSSSAFDHPICEVLLNQKYFNGIGNYLRAEILFRQSIPPFQQAREVLKGLPEMSPDVKPRVKGKSPSNQDTCSRTDILHLCHSVPLEVVNLGGGGYDPEGNQADNDFTKWLQCYYKDGMKNMADHNGRTIWFSGPAGPLIPKGKTVSPKKKKRSKKVKENVGAEEAPKKAKLVETKFERKSQVNGTNRRSTISGASQNKSREGQDVPKRGRTSEKAGISKTANRKQKVDSKGFTRRSARLQKM